MTSSAEGLVRYAGSFQLGGLADREGARHFRAPTALPASRACRPTIPIAGRDLERKLVPMLPLEKASALMVWSPLAGGLLSGKYKPRRAKAKAAAPSSTSPRSTRTRAFDIHRRHATDRQSARGVSVAQIAIAWLLHQRVVSSVIIGVRRLDQLADNIAACAVDLTVEELAALDGASRLPAEYPGWMLAVQGGYRETPGAQPSRWA